MYAVIQRRRERGKLIEGKEEREVEDRAREDIKDGVEEDVPVEEDVKGRRRVSR